MFQIFKVYVTAHASNVGDCFVIFLVQETMSFWYAIVNNCYMTLSKLKIMQVRWYLIPLSDSQHQDLNQKSAGYYYYVGALVLEGQMCFFSSNGSNGHGDL